jgi:hypothetical protein
MSTTRYEAAALYDSSRRKGGHPTHYLVLDLDTGSAGACSCDKDGRTTLTAAWKLPEETDLWTAWVGRIQGMLGADYPFDVASELARQLPEANRALRNYLTSDRLLDSTALTFGEWSLTCSQVEASFETVEATLRTLLQQGEALVPERARETMGIFPLGQAAHCYWVEHAIRAHFSADPFLPDERFVLDGFTQDSAQVIAQGMEQATANAVIPHTVTLVLTQAPDGQTQELPLLTKGAPPTQVTPEAYVGPIYIANGQPIVLKVDDVLRTVTLPYAMAPMDSDLIDLAAGEDSSGVTLSIRCSRMPTRVFTKQLL